MNKNALFMFSTLRKNASHDFLDDEGKAALIQSTWLSLVDQKEFFINDYQNESRPRASDDNEPLSPDAGSW